MMPQQDKDRWVIMALLQILQNQLATMQSSSEQIATANLIYEKVKELAADEY